MRRPEFDPKPYSSSSLSMPRAAVVLRCQQPAHHHPWEAIQVFCP